MPRVLDVKVLDVKVLGVEDVKRSRQRHRSFPKVAIQWGLAVEDTTLCYLVLVQDQLYLIIVFCGHSSQLPAGKAGKKNSKMDNSALDSFAASVGFPGRAKTCISDSIRTAGQHLKF